MSTSTDLYTLLDRLVIVHNHIDQLVMEPLALNTVRYWILCSINKEPGLSFTRLSELNLLDRASASRMIRSMEKKGLIERQLDEDDRRYYSLYLTEVGQSLYQAADKAFKTDIETRFEDVVQGDHSSIQDSLERTLDTLCAHRDRLLEDGIPATDR